MGYFTSDTGLLSIVQTTEDTGTTLDVTNYPVDEGSPISDHVQLQPQSMNLSGFILEIENMPSYDPEAGYKMLEEWQRNGKLVKWFGRIYMEDCVLSNLNRNYDRIKNGFAFSCTLTKVRRVKTSYQAKTQTTTGKQQTTPKKEEEVYVTVKRGDTYWGFWQAYGTSIQQLRDWNKYPDRQIPIGVRLRVK